MKLFHCVVVMGAALGSGCGAKEDGERPPPDGSTGAFAPADSGGLACGADAGLLSGAPGCFSSDPCPGSMAAPRRPQDCPLPQQLACDTSGRCVCDLTAPLAPGECASPAQFECADWATPCGCSCSDAAAVDPSMCGCDSGTAADAEAYCPRGAWQCRSYDPPVGCACRIAVAIL